MSDPEYQLQLSTEEAIQLMELAETAIAASNLEEFAEHALPCITSMLCSHSALLYAAESQLANPCFFQHGLQAEALPEIEELCAKQLDLFSGQAGSQPVAITPSATWGISTNLMLYPLRDEMTCIGIIGLTPQENIAFTSTELWEKLLCLITSAIKHLTERMKSEQQLNYLNSYLTVSSMLAQSLGLHELMETALYCSMEVVSAEAASVLLLDDEKNNFSFYQVEGPAKPLLMTATLPADKGLAGSVLQTQQPEIINDVQNDSRFYQKTDMESGFHTRNMIAIPLTADEEKIGVLEVLNKTDGASFTEDDHLLLLSIAEEIAFAIRNARIFEYVANTYCKQRQGQGSCKGCSRPLGSWTPCVKYREVDL